MSIILQLKKYNCLKQHALNLLVLWVRNLGTVHGSSGLGSLTRPQSGVSWGRVCFPAPLVVGDRKQLLEASCRCALRPACYWLEPLSAPFLLVPHTWRLASLEQVGERQQMGM